MLFKLPLIVIVFCLEISTSTQATNPYTASVSSTPGWMDKVHQFEHEAALLGHLLKAVFLGDSFIEGWQKQGAVIWSDKYQWLPSGNLGIQGDRTQNVLWRVENATISNVGPKVVILMVGGANIRDNDPVGDIAHGIRNILDVLERILPKTKIILNSVLPRNKLEEDNRVRELNKLISRFEDNKKVFFLDLTSQFETSVGKLKLELFNSTNLSALGYSKWDEALGPIFNRLIA